MGIRGLAAFINGKGVCFENAVLYNTTVIIDGFNILHEIYYSGQSDTVYGGDYDVFGKEVFYFIHKIRKAGIEPIFIFDGTEPLDGTKFNTSLERAQERVHLVKLALHRKRVRVLPTLAYRVFLEVLREQNVKFCIADFEADDELFVLACKLNCPLISNDSDFMLMPLPAGLISVDDFDPSTLTKISDGEAEEGERFVIPVRIYRYQKLMDFHRIRHASLLPVLALICGNDSFPAYRLKEFKRGFATEKGKETPKMSSILKWLSKFNNVEEAVNKIMESKGGSKKLLKQINGVLRSYNRTESHIEPFFNEGRITHTSTQDHFIFKILDDEIWTQIRTGKISKKILTTLIHGRHLLHSQMEDIWSLSAWYTSREIRKACYKIICETAEGRRTTITEYGRVKLYMKQRIVLDTSQETGPALSIVVMRKLSPRVLERWFIQQLIGTNQTISDELKQQADSIEFRDVEYISAFLVHWINHSDPQVNNLCLMALMVCTIKLQCIDTLLDGHPVRQSVKKYSHRPTQDWYSKDGINIKIIHSFSQLQAVISNSLDLLSLLDLQLTCSLRRLVSGRYMYNLVIELTKRTNPLLYCQQLLERSSIYSQFFTSWYQYVEQLVQEDRLLHFKSTGANHSKKTKRPAQPSHNLILPERVEPETVISPLTSNGKQDVTSSDKQEVTSSDSDDAIDRALTDEYAGDNKFSLLIGCE